MRAGDALREAAGLVEGARALAHGDMLDNHQNIAMLWSAYLQTRPDGTRSILNPSDVANMMALLKMARSQTGILNDDDYIDGAAYMAIAGDLASRE